MSKDDMNSLRPGQTVYYTVATTRSKGRVLSVWRNDRVQVRWSTGETDVLLIDEDTAKFLTLA